MDRTPEQQIIDGYLSSDWKKGQRLYNEQDILDMFKQHKEYILSNQKNNELKWIPMPITIS